MKLCSNNGTEIKVPKTDPVMMVEVSTCRETYEDHRLPIKKVQEFLNLRRSLMLVPDRLWLDHT